MTAGIEARRAALRLLDAVLRRGQPLEAALAGATRTLDRPEDRALARAIASETLRHLVGLDALIDGATRLRLADDVKVRMVLRLALAQRLAMGTPPHAVIATALPLLEGGPRRLAHGVLGTIFRQNARLAAPPLLPAAVDARWRRAWGEGMIGDASEALSQPPPLGRSFKDGSHDTVPAGTDVTTLPGFADGAFWIQNIAAALPARLLGPGEKKQALDLCAAPGGKTMQLASAGWAVTAVDLSESRLKRVRENLSRVRLRAELVQANVLKWSPSAGVDAILLDAPCSATGIFARHPDNLYRVREKDIALLADMQRAMIERSARWLNPGGKLVYATCSLEPEEGEAQVEVAKRAGLSLDRVTDSELPPGFAPNDAGWLRILPRAGVDGFFIARFVRA